MKKYLMKTAKIGAVAVALYAATGFLLLPYIIETQAKKILPQKIGSQPEIGDVYFNPFTFVLAIEAFTLPETASASPRLNFEKVEVNLSPWPLLKKEIRLQSVMISGAQAAFTIQRDGSTNWQVIPDPNAPAEETEAVGDWVLNLQKIQIENSSVNFADYTHREPLKVPIGPLNLSARDIRTAIGADAAIESLHLSIGYKGFLKVGGSMGLKPVRADVRFEAGSLPTDFLTAYLSDKTYLAIQGGLLDLNGQLQYGDSGIKISGDAQVRDFVLINTRDRKNAVTWDELNLKGISLQTAPVRFQLQSLELVKPTGSIALEKNGTLNVKEYMRTAPAKPEGAQTKSAPDENVKTSANVKWKIEKILIRDAKLDFADRQIRPSFAARIDRLTGEIAPLSSIPTESSKVELVGRVEDYGKFRASGTVLPFAKTPDLNLNVNFSNIELTTFTPYSGKFAGYEIEKGKLFLDLKYTLVKNKIRGQNQVMLDQFTLGKEVDSEDATGLPLRFALALMQDRKGQIRFQLPVEGDVNSPSFSLSNLIFTALKNMLINIVAAPFDFISGMLGGGKDLKAVSFEPAKEELLPEEIQKIAEISQVLEERPALVIEVQGLYHPQDLQTLKQQYKDSSEEALKKLALRRGQRVQAELVKNAVAEERVYLLVGGADTAAEKNTDAKPHVQLNLKAK